MTYDGVTILPSGLVALLDGAELTTPSWPLVMPALAALAGLAAAVTFVVAAFREGCGRAGLAWLPPFAALLVAAATNSLPRALFFSSEAHSTFGAFGPALDACASLTGTPLLLAGVGAAAWMAAPAREGRVVAMGAGASAVLAGLFALATAIWSAWLLSIGPIPDLAPTVPARVHVGASLTVPAPDLPGWATAPIELHPAAPGPLPWTTTASRFGLTLTTHGTTEAGRDESSPLFVLAMGNRWTFGSTTSWHDQYLWFVSSSHEVPGTGYTFTVTSENRNDGIHTYELVRTLGAEPPERWTLYGWNGDTLEVARTGTGAPAPGDQPFVVLSGLPSESGPRVQACTFGGLEGYGCTCYLQPPSADVKLAGPARCVVSRGGIGSAIVSGLLALVTVGLVIEDPDRTEVQELLSSGGS